MSWVDQASHLESTWTLALALENTWDQPGEHLDLDQPGEHLDLDQPGPGEHLETPENTWTLALDQLVRKSVQTNLGRNVAQIWLVKTLLPTYLVGNQPVW